MIGKQILLINPDWTGIKHQKQRQFKRLWPPLCLATSAAMLENNGFEVQILDNQVLGLTPKQIGDYVKEFDKVFVTSTPYDRWQCPSLDIGFFFKTIKHIEKHKLYIMGSHVTQRPQAILAASNARAAIFSEPEAAILDICLHDHKSLSDKGRKKISGTAWLENGRLVTTTPRGFEKNLDDFPYPAFHLLDMDKYHYMPVMGGKFAILEASRGCPGKCNFCYMGMYGHKVRRKSIARFLDEVQYVVERFKIKNIYFMDLEFCLSKKFVKSFCQGLLDRSIKINWCCQTRVTDINEEIASLMARSGCSLIHFGVEAGSDKILTQTGKGIRKVDCVKAVNLCKQYKMRTALFMNFGFPGETREQMLETIKLSLKLDPTYAAFHLIVPFPGTKMAQDLGLNPEDFPAHQYPHYNYFDHDLKKLKKMMHRAYLRFYLRPAPIFRLLNEFRALYGEKL